MMTLLQLVNAVQKRLREDQTAAYNTNDYSLFITEMVNEVKREVEDAWDWSVLRGQYTFNTSSGTNKYYLTGAGDRFRVLKEPETGALSVYNTTDNYHLSERSSQWIRRILGTSTVSQQDPTYFAFEGQDASGDPGVLLYETPNNTKTIEFNLVVPQADLAADATELTVPDYPVILGTWARCISERGEDGGLSYQEIDKKYHDALSDAIAQDERRVCNETTWTVE
jgi:hypothetical protein